MDSHTRRISVRQAERGIYFDFECFKGKPPSIAGICIGSEFRQVVLDTSLISAAEAKNMPIESLREFVERLLDDCELNNRFIIAFSIHERSVIQTHCGIDISRRYKNALKIAVKWKRRFHPDIETERNSLDQFLRLPGVNYEVPRHLGKDLATKRLKAVVDGLAKRGEYAKLTPTQKAKWTKLLDYNRHDVLGLQALMMRAAEDLNR